MVLFCMDIFSFKSIIFKVKHKKNNGNTKYFCVFYYEYWLSLTDLGKQFVEWVEEETRQ